MFWYIISTFAMSFTGIAIYIAYLKKGQFEDSEDVKYQILREEEE